MQSKKISQQSQSACVDSIFVTERKVSEFVSLIERWGCNEKSIVSDILNKDEEYNDLEVKIDEYKLLVIEKVIQQFEPQDRLVFMQFIRLVEDQNELVKSTADMIVNDLVNISN